MKLLRTSNAFMRLWTLQSVNHKKRRSTSCRLMVERLETRDLLSASTLMAVDDGPFTIDKNTTITIAVLANDTISGTISIVIVPNPLYGNAVVNPDNTVTYTPFVNAVGADLFDYAITNGSYTSSASVRLNIGVDPYVIYKADVSLANQVYRDNVLTEAAMRQTSIEGARIAAQSSALQAYADYEIAVSQAKQGYSASASLAETNYQSAVRTATATYQSSIDQAYTTYNAAVDSVYITYNATMAVIDQTHLNALAAADAAYGEAVTPYQTALNSAQAHYDANPENPEAQAALAQAKANFDAATNAQDNYVYAASWSAGYDAAGVPTSSFSDNHHAWGSSSNSGSSYWFTRWTPQGGVTTSASDSSAASNSSSYNTNPGAAEIGSPSVPAVGTAVGLDEGVVACGGLDEGVVACGGPLPLAAAVAGAAAPEPPPASKGFWGHAGDFASGIWHSGKEAVGGIKDLAVGGFYLSSLGSLVNPDQSRQTAETVVTVASTVWNNPGVIWDAIADPYKTAWKEGRPGEAIGRGVTEVFIGVVGAKGVNYLVKPAKGSKLGSVATKADDVAKVANFPWMFWGNLPKMTVNGKTYAQIGGRLYTQHAVDRMLPSGLGAPAGAGPSGAGRSIAPAFVEEVIRNGAAQRGQIVNGAQRTIHTSGTVQIITEDGGRIVITVNNITP